MATNKAEGQLGLYVVSYFDDNDAEPTVTLFRDGPAAKLYQKFLMFSKHKRVALDYCPIYDSFSWTASGEDENDAVLENDHALKIWPKNYAIIRMEPIVLEGMNKEEKEVFENLLNRRNILEFRCGERSVLLQPIEPADDTKPEDETREAFRSALGIDEEE